MERWRLHAARRQVEEAVQPVGMAGTMTRGPRQGERHPPRRVLLLSESAGLAAVLGRLLDRPDRLRRLSSLRELAEGRELEATDAVVLDLRRDDRAAAIGQVRRRYLGPLVVLVGKGDDGGGGLYPDDACTLLARPFSSIDLGAALAIPVLARPAPTGAALAPPAAATAAGAAQAGRGAVPPGAVLLSAAARTARAGKAGTAVDPKAAARPAPFRPVPVAAAPGKGGLIDRARRMLVALTQGWQARRRVRVAGFSIFALVAFTVAFALAAQGRCGPGCDALGTGFSPAPTIAPGESPAPPTTGPKRAPGSTAAPVGSPATDAFRGISGGGLATTTTERRATTTTGKPSSGGGGPGTTTPTTRPPTPTTAAPTTTPTTAPPTTATTLPPPPPA